MKKLIAAGVFVFILNRKFFIKIGQEKQLYLSPVLLFLPETLEKNILDLH